MSNSSNNFLINIYSTLKRNYFTVKYLYSEEKGTNSDQSFIDRLKLNFRGFTSEKPSLYGSDLKNELYLSDTQRFRTRSINGNYSVILGNKLITTKYLQNYNALPRVYGNIYNGRIMINKDYVEFNDFLSFLGEKKSLMLKDINGGGGTGVYRLDYKDNELMLDYEPISIGEFRDLVSTLNEFYISEVIVQAPYASEIYPRTVNTMRVLMMKDPSTKEFFIATAIHKFGSSKTGSADNVWRGGLTSLIDLETGELQKPALHKNHNREVEWIERHPDTLVKIEGIKVPNWEEVKAQLIQYSNEFPMLDYIGWDAVITNDGVRLIEGNNHSRVNILQIHKPLLDNPRVRRFYRHHNVIK